MGVGSVVTSILNGTFQESVHQCVAKYADEDVEGVRRELNEEQSLKVSEFIGRTMIRFLIGELNLNCSSLVMAVPSKVSTSIRVLSVRMAELNPILKNKRDAERQLKNFEDKLVLKNSGTGTTRLR